MMVDYRMICESDEKSGEREISPVAYQSSFLSGSNRWVFFKCVVYEENPEWIANPLEVTRACSALEDISAGTYIVYGVTLSENQVELDPADELHLPQSKKILEFPNEPYEIIKPIPIEFRLGDPSGIVASFKEANIASVDETWVEAYKGLQVEILNTLEGYEENEAHLGPEPLRQLRVLRSYIHRRG